LSRPDRDQSDEGAAHIAVPDSVVHTSSAIPAKPFRRGGEGDDRIGRALRFPGLAPAPSTTSSGRRPMSTLRWPWSGSLRL